MKLKNKVCVITGSTSGIGFELAQALAKAEARVVIIGFEQTDCDSALVRLKEKCPQAQAIAVLIDVRFTDSVRRGFQTIKDQYGAIDVLINNAGVTTAKGITETTDQDYDRIINTNLGGVFRCTREALKYMKQPGSIINTASLNGIYGAPNQAIYSASKAAIIGFTKSLAKELGKCQIRVNAVAPGVIDTGMVQANVSEATKKRLIELTPLHRVGSPRDLVGIYLLLASSDSSYITGAIISVDGGLVI